MISLNMSKRSIILITGGTGNLGTELTRFLLKGDNRIYCTYIFENELNRFGDIEKKNINFINCDLTCMDSTDECINKIITEDNKIDSLIKLVGGFQQKKFIESNLEDAKEMMNMNYFSVFNICNLSVKALLKSENASIINIGAEAGEIGFENMTAYSASKAALINLSKTLSKELKKLEIRVTCIIPGTIDTQDNRNLMPNDDHSKWVHPLDIAKTISYLISENSKASNSNFIRMEDINNE